MAGKRYSKSVFELMSSQGSTGASTGISSDADNNGVLGVAGLDQVAVQLGGGGSTYAADINFQVTVDGSNWINALAMNKADGSQADTVSNDSGIHIIPITGMSGFRLNVAAYTDGNVTGFARATVGGGNLSMADVDISLGTDVSSDLADSDVALFLWDSGGAAVAWAADTAAPQQPAAYISPSNDSDGFWGKIYGNDTAGGSVALDADTATLSVASLRTQLPFADTAGAESPNPWVVWNGGTVDAQDIAGGHLPGVANFPMVFNGTTWDRIIGDTVGGQVVQIRGLDSAGVQSEFELAKLNSSAPDFSGNDALLAIAQLVGWNTGSAVNLRLAAQNGGEVFDTEAGDALRVAGVSFVEGADTTAAPVAMQADSNQRLRVSETWNSTLQVNESTAVQDKTFAVTADEDWHVMWAWVEYTSNASAGNRQVVMQVRDSADDVIMELVPGVTQAASLTYKYLFAPGMSDLTAVRDTDYIMTPMPPTLILPELFDIRIFDRAVITGGDTANEEAIVQMMVMNRARVST